MINKTSKAFLGAGIGIVVILLICGLIFIMADRSNFAPQFNVELTFADTMGTLLAVGLALVAIAYSIKKADIKIYLADKASTPAGTVQEIRIVNTGDATADLAMASVELLVPATSPISFTGATELPFQPSQNFGRKQYRFEDCQNPRNLYPVKDDSILIGSVQIPIGAAHQLKFNVHIVGSHGHTQKEFKITV
jgi:hypothetical protein